MGLAGFVVTRWARKIILIQELLLIANARGGRSQAAVGLYRLQICVRCWVSEDSQHCDDLAFVVKCVGDDV